MSVAQGTSPDLPGYCARTFTLMPVGFTSQRSVQVLGFADTCLLTPLRRLHPLPVRQASALPSASSGFAVARDTLAVRLTLLLAECVEDFHLQVRAPCRAHKRKGRSSIGRFQTALSFVLQGAPASARRRPHAEQTKCQQTERCRFGNRGNVSSGRQQRDLCAQQLRGVLVRQTRVVGK
jgi:hypothetical protein